MENKAYSVSLENNPLITMRVISGHFTTSNSHLSHFLDVSSLKANAKVAREVAKEISLPYLSSTLVDTIVCMERTEVIGAFLAEKLMESGMTSINGGDIHVVTPIRNDIGNLSFKSSTVGLLSGKNTLMLTTSISSGRTLDSALDCLAYYRAKVVGISALFAVVAEYPGLPLHALFTSARIPGYKSYSSRDCDMCRAGIPLDALVSSEGFTKI